MVHPRLLCFLNSSLYNQPNKQHLKCVCAQVILGSLSLLRVAPTNPSYKLEVVH